MNGSPAPSSLVLVLLLLALVGGVGLPAVSQPPALRWQPPPQGGVEMFRQAPRAFVVGPEGAGGEKVPVETAPSGSEPASVDLVVDLAPQSTWDLPEGPTAHQLSSGTIFLYRPGEWRPAFVGRAGEPIALPPGKYWLMAEAPGFATTASNLLPVAPHPEKVRRTFVTGVAPACRVELSPRADWSTVERLDVVSFTEGTVYPIAPAERSALWVPAGELMAYSVTGGRIDAFGDVRTCREGETVRLSRPRPPAAGRAASIVTLELPRATDPTDRRLGAELLAPAGQVDGVVRFPPAGVAWQERRATFFFLDLPEDVPLSIELDDPGLVFSLPATPVRGVDVRRVLLHRRIEER